MVQLSSARRLAILYIKQHDFILVAIFTLSNISFNYRQRAV